MDSCNPSELEMQGSDRNEHHEGERERGKITGKRIRKGAKNRDGRGAVLDGWRWSRGTGWRIDLEK